MDDEAFISWTITTKITPESQKLYKYFLVTANENRILTATALQRDPKHYTYKYDAAFIEQHSDLIEDVGILELKNTVNSQVVRACPIICLTIS